MICGNCQANGVITTLVDRGDHTFCPRCGRITPIVEPPVHPVKRYRFPTINELWR